MAVRSRPPSGSLARSKTSSSLEVAAQEHEGPTTSAPLSFILKEVNVIDNRYTCKVYVDDSERMNALMCHARPTPPLPLRAEAVPEAPGEPEVQSYTKALIRSMDEAARRRRHVPAVSSAGASLAPSARSFLAAAPGGAESASSGRSRPPSSRPALEVWAEETPLGNRRCSPALNPSVTHKAANSITKGRFPHERTPKLSDSIRSWRSDGRIVTCPEAFVLSPDHELEKRQKLDELKQKTMMHSSCSLRHFLAPPSSENYESNGLRKSKEYVCEAVAERKRREFDYKDYAEHCCIDETLDRRAHCRDMVIGEVLKDKEGSLTNPLVALGSMFDNGEGHSASGEAHLDKRVKGSLWSSVWTRKANEMALERERKHIIEDIQSFKLCVAAASLSREAVEKLQADLIKTVQKWPCKYKKHHIYTRSNFEAWIRKRYNLPGSEAARDRILPSLSESMNSSAEAAFVEYMLSVLPENTFEHQNRLE